MRESRNSNRFCNRTTAFLLILAMMLSMCTPLVFAADDTLNGTVTVSGVSDNGKIATQEQKVLLGEFEYGNQAGTAQADARIYFGDSLDKITLTNFASMTVGATYGPYTICYDSSLNEYYLSMSGVSAGSISNFALTFEFNSNVINGDFVTFKVCNGSEQIEAEIGEYTAYTVYAEAEAKWGNAKSANPAYVLLNSGAATLNNNTSNASAITYTITEAESDGSDSSNLAVGEAAIYSYTSYDTVSLPAGMYISAGSNATEAIWSAYSISGVDYTIENIEYDNSDPTKITGFTASWTKINDGAVNGTPMHKTTHTATLDASKVVVGDDYSVGNISNSVYTKYVTKSYDENGTLQDVVAQTTPVTAETSVSEDGSGLGGATKSIYQIESKSANYSAWNNSVNGYVVAGDRIRYTVTINNNSANQNVYTVTDLFNNYNLEFEKFDGYNWREEGSTVYPYNNCTVSEFDASTDSFTVTVNGNTTAEFWFWAKVKGDKDFTITNTATVSLSDGLSLDATAQSIPQQVKTPALALSKTVEGLKDGNVYKLGDEFYYCINISNIGTGVAQSISFTDSLPADVTFIDEGSADFTYADGIVSGTVENLEAGASKIIKVKVKANEDSVASSIENTATAILGDDTKTASVTIKRNTADVSKLIINKAADKNKYVYPGDLVTYTITVTNPYGSGTLENATFNVKDVLPDGLIYVSDTASTVSGVTTVDADGNVTVAFTNVTMSNNGSLTFTIICKVPENATADSNYDNTVVIFDANGEYNSSTDTSISGGGASANSNILVDKKMYDVNGNEITSGEIIAGDTIEFRVTVTNNSDTTLNEFTIKDTFAGRYAEENSWTKIPVKLFSITDGSSIGKITAEGLLFNGQPIYILSSGATSTWHFNGTFGYGDYGAYNDGYQRDTYTGLLPKGSVTLSYSVTTAADFTAGSNTVLATAADGTSANDTVNYVAVTATPTPAVTDDPNETPAPTEAPSSQLTITKVVTDGKSAKTVSDINAEAAKAEIENYRFGYTVTVTNTTGADYTTTNAVFTDVIPEGFALSIDSYAWNYSGSYNEDCAAQTVYIKGSYYDDWKNIHPIYYTTDDVSDASWYYNDFVTINVDGKSISSGPWQTLVANNPGLAFKDDWDNNIVPDGASYKVDGKNLTVKFNNTITIPVGQSLTFTYYLTPTTAEAEEIYNEMIANGGKTDFADRTYKNEATFSGDRAFYNAKGAAVTSIMATETVEILSPKIHPGLEKTAIYGISASDDKDNIVIGETALSQNDVFVWKVTVYNALDHAGGGKEISGYKITDSYPDYYTYGGKSYSNSKYSFDASWTIYGANNNVIASGTGDTYVEPDANGVFDFSAPKYAIPAGGRLEFTVITVPTVTGTELTPYGLYTNTVTLELIQDFENSNVVSGTVLPDKTVQASDTIPLYLVSTSSSKAISVTAEDGTVSNASSDNSALANYVGATMGDTVTYTLQVKNHDLVNYLEDFSIIDRLPAEDDAGVITENQRGSMFRLTYLGNMKAVVTLEDGREIDVTDYISTAFASASTEVFEPGDIDWLDTGAQRAATRVAWTNSSTASTNLVRFCLSKLSSYSGTEFAREYTDSTGAKYTKYGVPPKSTITITYDAKIPSYVEDTGDGNFAWNSFAYYFNADIAENMVAEPGKVGVWVDDTTTGGSILLRKNYSTNMPGEEVTFHFALFDGLYDGSSLHNRVDTADITMTGTASGTYAETYFMNIDYRSSTSGGMYYIYETDENYVPLKADGMEYETQTFYLKDSNGQNTGETIQKTVVVSKTVDHGKYDFVMDNQPQINQALAKYSDREYEGEVAAYNSEYLVWHKDINANKTYNTAIFTNSYEAGVDTTIMGPFYADVPTDKSVATQGMTSTRPTSFEGGKISEVQDSTVRDEGNYAADATYGTTAQYGGDQKHTIATGFLALLESEGKFTLEQAKWKITTSKPDASNAGVYVRLRTEAAETSGLNLMYLDDFEVFEEESDGALELGSVGGFDDIMDDETFISDYTVEERAAMVAEGLGIDPANIEYDENGLPYVVVDEELASEALSFSEVSENTTATSDFVKGNTSLSIAGFKDATTTTGYIIYRLHGTEQYSIELNDNIPHITLESGSKAYVGIVIDQLYDQDATATIELSDEVSYDDAVLVAATAASEKNYTKVVSPFQKNGFSIGAFMKLTAGKTYYFNNFVEETTKTEANVVNADNTIKVTAASGKAITVNVRDFNFYGWSADGNIESYNYDSYLSLNGSGRKDYRSVVVNVPDGATLRVIARSSGADDRTLVIEDSTGEKQTVIAPGSNNENVTAALAMQSVTITNGGAVYLYSAGSGIDVCSVEIVK